MARLPRYFVKGVPLHIILRGNNREPIFGSDEDRQFFKQALLEAVKRHGMPVHAYVLMTNHIHLLASPSQAKGKTRPYLGGRVYAISDCRGNGFIGIAHQPVD